MSTVIELTDDLETCLALRFEVFVHEQNVPEELERDEEDDTALHLLARSEGVPVGTARIVLKGESGKIGRVCVRKSQRGTGLGAALIRKALEILSTQPGISRAVLGAQIHAIGFYEALGFSAFGPVYLDAGIDHRDMERAL